MQKQAAHGCFECVCAYACVCFRAKIYLCRSGRYGFNDFRQIHCLENRLCIIDYRPSNTCLSLMLVFLSLHLPVSVYLSLYLSLSPSIYLSLYQPVSQSTYLYIYLALHLPVSLSTCLFVLSVYSLHLSIMSAQLLSGCQCVTRAKSQRQQKSLQR